MPSAEPKQPTFNVAFAGPGMISHFHMIGWRKPGNRARPVAVCDPVVSENSSDAQAQAARW